MVVDKQNAVTLSASRSSRKAERFSCQRKCLVSANSAHRTETVENLHNLGQQVREQERSGWGYVGSFLTGLTTDKSLTCLKIKLQSASSSGSEKICPDCPWKTKMSCDRDGIMDDSRQAHTHLNIGNSLLWHFLLLLYVNYIVNLQNNVFSLMT